MPVVAFDTETSLIRPACLAPPLVCVTWARPGQQPQIVHHADPRCEQVLRQWLTSDKVVGHNVAYDLAVVCERFPALRPLVFQAYEQDRVTDTQIRQQLLDIASGCYRGSVSTKGKRIVYEYTLEALAKRCAGIVLQKDEWRLSYGEFRDVPLDLWGARARELQAKALERLIYTGSESEAFTKEEEKTIESLRSMVNGDPDRCRTYPLDDARATLAVYEAQEKHVDYLEDQFRQARAAWALHLESAWGLRTDAAGVARLRATVQAEYEELDEELRILGLVKEDGVRDTKAAKRRMVQACADEGIPVVRTDAHFAEKSTWHERQARGEKPRCSALDGTPLDDGHDDCAEHVCLDGDACDRSGDEVLLAYAARTTLAKQLTNDIVALEKGVEYPVHTRYGLAATGRSTSSKPNIQNQSKREGFREAFVPRPGMLFAEADYPGLELYTWAQCCAVWFGFSKLADALNSGMDPHLMLGADLLGISYEQALANKKSPEVKRARQQAKPGNFGFAGGMGIPKFYATTRKQVISSAGRKAWDELGLTEELCKVLKDKWEARWPEAKPHFARVRELTAGGLANVETLFTQRHRGGATYCATANNGFQALGADIAKEAAWRIARAQHVGTPSASWKLAHPGMQSPLFNSRAVAFIHDEFISEVPDDERAHDAAWEQADLMLEAANHYLPDVPISREKMEPLLMSRWSKAAVSTFDLNRRLITWAL